MTGQSPEYLLKAKINSSTCQQDLEKLKSTRKCFFGVKLGTSFTEKLLLKASGHWIANNFNECVILVDDSMYRHALQMQRGLNTFKAEQIALEKGLEFIEENRPLFTEIPRCKFSFILASEIQKSTDYILFYDRLRMEFLSHLDFARKIQIVASQNVLKGKIKGKIQENMLKSSRYLLEELAVFSCISKLGYAAFVYTGSDLNILMKAKEHEMVPAELKHLVGISLRLKNDKVA